MAIGFNIFIAVVLFVAAALLTVLIARFFFSSDAEAGNGTKPAAESRIQPSATADATQAHRLLAKRIVISAVLTALVLLPLVFRLFGATVPPWTVNRWLQAIAITPVMFYCAYPIHTDGWRAIRHRHPNMDSLASIGMIAAYAYSLLICVAAAAVPAGMRQTYFEFVGVIATLVLLARFVTERWLPAAQSFPLQQRADDIARVFVPVILIVAVWTFAVWLLFSPAPHLPTALITGISVLIIACPCALGWASPLSASLALDSARRAGIEISSAAALQNAANIRSVVFSSAVAAQAKEAMAQLNKSGIRTSVLDVASPAAVATELQALKHFHATASRGALIAFVALPGEAPQIRAAADIAITYVPQGSGSEAIQDSSRAASGNAYETLGGAEDADIVIAGAQTSRILDVMRLSRATVHNVQENLVWTFVFNVIGIPIAAGVLYPFTGWLLNPMLAAVAMLLSSVFVLLNSLRMRHYLDRNSR